jgi:hypothetical protein
MLARSLALTLAACSVANGARVVVSTDLGWRTAPYNLSCSFPTPTGPGVQCQGLGNAPEGNASAAACAATACARGAAMWQFAPRPNNNECWVGPASLNCSAPGAGTDPEPWVGAYGAGGRAPPPPDAPEAQPGFDDSQWRVLDTPHDATVEGAYNPRADGGEGFLPPVVQFYRKHFFVPAAWAGAAVTLTLDASLSTSTFWLNGRQLVVARPSGYLPLSLRLDGAAGLVVGGANVFAAYVDGSETTGWWYEGSGLIRHSRLVVTPADAYIAPSGVAAPAFVTGAYGAHGAPADGLFANATVSPSVDVVATGAFAVAWRLISADGAAVVATAAGSGNGSSTVFAAPMAVADAELWSVARPYLYTLETTVSTAAGGADAVNTSVGVRVITFDAERGMFVNEQAVKMRGFCNHESFTGVGGALPDRVDLLRVQQLRGVGGNAWRTSHNPPEEVLLDLTDRLGVLVLDENRVLATLANCVGPKCQRVPAYAGDPAADVASLALRDRAHASVFAYSLCNEAGCGDGSLLANDTVVAAKQAAYDVDGSRLVGANMGWLSPTAPRTPMSDALDLMGFSHVSSAVIAAFHDREPAKPLTMSECCSCEGQRGENDDQPHNASVYYSDHTAACLHAQVSVSDVPEFISGTFVWSESPCRVTPPPEGAARRARSYAPPHPRPPRPRAQLSTTTWESPGIGPTFHLPSAPSTSRPFPRPRRRGSAPSGCRRSPRPTRRARPLRPRRRRRRTSSSCGRRRSAASRRARCTCTRTRRSRASS